MKSGSLTPKGLHFLCLSPEDLKTRYFALSNRDCSALIFILILDFKILP